MARVESFTYELTQSVSTPCYDGDSVEASFLSRGSSGVNAYTSQSVDLYYATNSESISWTRISSDFPKTFSIGTTYVTRSFVDGLSNDAQALKLVITGSVNSTASYSIPTGDSGERLGLKIKYDDFKLAYNYARDFIKSGESHKHLMKIKNG